MPSSREQAFCLLVCAVPKHTCTHAVMRTQKHARNNRHNTVTLRRDARRQKRKTKPELHVRNTAARSLLYEAHHGTIAGIYPRINKACPLPLPVLHTTVSSSPPKHLHNTHSSMSALCHRQYGVLARESRIGPTAVPELTTDTHCHEPHCLCTKTLTRLSSKQKSNCQSKKRGRNITHTHKERQKTGIQEAPFASQAGEKQHVEIRKNEGTHMQTLQTCANHYQHAAHGNWSQTETAAETTGTDPFVPLSP